MSDTLKVVAMAQKFNRSPQALRWSVLAVIRTLQPHAMWFSEIGPGNPERAKILKTIPGYKLIHFKGLGASECGILYKIDPELEFIRSGAREYLQTWYRVPGGKNRANVHTVWGQFQFGFRSVYIGGKHYPNTTGDMKFKPPTDRVNAWKRTVQEDVRFYNFQAPAIDLSDYNCNFKQNNEMRKHLDTNMAKVNMKRVPGNNIRGVVNGYFRGFKVVDYRMLKRNWQKSSDHPYIYFELKPI
jgi:hypothetical protein